MKDKPTFQTDRERQMFEAGRKYEIEKEKEATEDDALTIEEIQKLTPEEHIARKVEVDKALEAMGQDR